MSYIQDSRFKNFIGHMLTPDVQWNDKNERTIWNNTVYIHPSIHLFSKAAKKIVAHHPGLCKKKKKTLENVQHSTQQFVVPATFVV